MPYERLWFPSVLLLISVVLFVNAIREDKKCHYGGSLSAIFFLEDEEAVAMHSPGWELASNGFVRFPLT